VKRPCVFVDTGAFFALQAKDDAHYREAKTVLPQLLSSCERLLTSNLVIAETYALLRMTKGFAEAWKFLEAVGESPRMSVLYADRTIERDARDWLRRFNDHDFSYADAVSFAFMKKERITHAFAFDVHFSIAGFLRIPGDAKSP
jgi:predicted nucleic acid-binding protein